MNFESGGSHYDRRGKVKLSPPDPKTGERAVGAVQIKPSTAREVGVKDPFDENENIRAGLRYFAKGGSDPAGRRIHYFGGPRPLKSYQRTGRIPKGKDVLGTTFEKYVQQTGGQQKDKPKLDLSAGLVDNLEAGLEDSGQNPPPEIAASKEQPATAPSVPKTYWGRVRERMGVPVKRAQQTLPSDVSLGLTSAAVIIVIAAATWVSARAGLPAGLDVYTRAEFLWFLIHDEIHHRGQFSIYLRMSGAKVPSIYGPSGDEPWT